MLNGSCLCEAVKFTVDIDPKASSTETKVCHCRSCRKITGSYVSLNLSVPATSFSLTSGNLKTVSREHVDYKGFKFSLCFCPDCGSPIYAKPGGQENMIIIQVGALDDVALLEKKPTVEMNTKNKLGWVHDIDGAKQLEGYV